MNFAGNHLKYWNLIHHHIHQRLVLFVVSFRSELFYLSCMESVGSERTNHGCQIERNHWSQTPGAHVDEAVVLRNFKTREITRKHYVIMQSQRWNVMMMFGRRKINLKTNVRLIIEETHFDWPNACHRGGGEIRCIDHCASAPWVTSSWSSNFSSAFQVVSQQTSTYFQRFYRLRKYGSCKTRAQQLQHNNITTPTQKLFKQHVLYHIILNILNVLCSIGPFLFYVGIPCLYSMFMHIYISWTKIVQISPLIGELCVPSWSE